MELVRKTLDEVYGAGKVSMVSATFRWLNHHSAMKPERNGILNDKFNNQLLNNYSRFDPFVIFYRWRYHWWERTAPLSIQP
jgi:hypothetical protein